MTPDHIRCLRMLALSNEERMKLYAHPPLSPDAAWFLEHIDCLAPELKQIGWVQEQPFNGAKGAVLVTRGKSESVVVTRGKGDVRMLVVTELGQKQLNAAVVL